MLTRRIITALTLAAFVSATPGCAGRVTLPVDTDFTKKPSVNRAHDPVQIAGYTTADSGKQDWKGWVRATSIDSLEFFRGAPSGRQTGNRPESFRLARAEVVSLEMIEQGDNTTALVIGLVAASVAMTAIVIAVSEDETNY